MPQRIKRSGTGASADGACVLTVFASTAHRALVAQTCARVDPASRVVDAATATDAVLILLSQPVDVLLIDVTWVGDLLAALERHARRSAPHAVALSFGAPSTPGAARAWSRIFSWDELVPALEALLGGDGPRHRSLLVPD